MAIPAHIRRLRELVGNELLLLPSVAVLVRDAEQRVLLVEHAELRVWMLPGGLLEPGERPEEGAAREAAEETGLEIAVGGPLGVFGGPDFDVTYANGDRVAFMVAVFAGELRGGSLRPDGEEIRSAGWFAAGELAGLALSPRVQLVLERLL